MVKGLKRLQSVLFAPLAQTGPCVPSLELQYITTPMWKDGRGQACLQAKSRPAFLA